MLTCHLFSPPNTSGLSSECNHLFCDSCIVSALEAVLKAGHFPAFCPSCKAEAAQRAQPCSIGTISPQVLTFLHNRGIIDQALRWRLLMESRRVVQEKMDNFFPCPSSCGNFIIVDNSKIYTKAVKSIGGKLEVQASVGICDCGTKVCGKAFTLSFFFSHSSLFSA